jgi:uncharacterized BrkB/YihY/UPF0761 family membrane protein
MSLNPFGNPDFAKNATDTVERYVGLVRDNTTTKVIKGARFVVFGLIAAFGAFIAAILLLVIATRLLQILWALPFDHDSSVWLSYMTLGGLLSLVGLLLMSKRHRPAE